MSLAKTPIEKIPIVNSTDDPNLSDDFLWLRKFLKDLHDTLNAIETESKNNGYAVPPDDSQSGLTLQMAITLASGVLFFCKCLIDSPNRHTYSNCMPDEHSQKLPKIISDFKRLIQAVKAFHVAKLSHQESKFSFEIFLAQMSGKENISQAEALRLIEIIYQKSITVYNRLILSNQPDGLNQDNFADSYYLLLLLGIDEYQQPIQSFFRTKADLNTVKKLILSRILDPNFHHQEPMAVSDLTDTPLHIAAYFGYDEIVRLLLQEGADPTIQNQIDETPKALAQACNHQTTVDVFNQYEEKQQRAKERELAEREEKLRKEQDEQYEYEPQRMKDGAETQQRQNAEQNAPFTVNSLESSIKNSNSLFFEEESGDFEIEEAPLLAVQKAQSVAGQTYTIQERFESLTVDTQRAILQHLAIEDTSQLEKRIDDLRNQLLSSAAIDDFFRNEENFMLLPLLWKIESPPADAVFNQTLAQKIAPFYDYEQPDKQEDNHQFSFNFRGDVEFAASDFNKWKQNKRRIPKKILQSNSECLAYAQLNFSDAILCLNHKKYNFFRANLAGTQFEIYDTGNINIEANFAEADLQTSTLHFMCDHGKFNFMRANLTSATLNGISILSKGFDFSASHLQDTHWVNCEFEKAIISVEQLVTVNDLYDCVLPQNTINALTITQKIQLEQKVMQGLIIRKVAKLASESDIGQISEQDKNFIAAKFHIAQCLGADYLGNWDWSVAAMTHPKNPKELFSVLSKKFPSPATFKSYLQPHLTHIIDQYDQGWWWPLRWLRSLWFAPHENRKKHLATLKGLIDSPKENLVEITQALMNIYNEIRQENNWFKSTLLSAIEQSVRALLEDPLTGLTLQDQAGGDDNPLNLNESIKKRPAVTNFGVHQGLSAKLKHQTPQLSLYASNTVNVYDTEKLKAEEAQRKFTEILTNQGLDFTKAMAQIRVHGYTDGVIQKGYNDQGFYLTYEYYGDMFEVGDADSQAEFQKGCQLVQTLVGDNVSSRIPLYKNCIVIEVDTVLNMDLKNTQNVKCG